MVYLNTFHDDSNSINILEETKRMILDIYMMIVGIWLVFVIYSFVIKDNDNYTHILTAVTAGILSFMLAYITYDGITDEYVMVINSVITTHSLNYAPGSIAYFFSIFGIVMIVYSVVHAIDIVYGDIREL